ncbi:hypothetical protein EGW08_019046 [Elysia chlorotica]|uniref:Tubulin--tyrosine ligase-like protein 9 n=1 Tax=Elysia chlorotica TaxID=188477 RepID=A0A3S1B266_ELYCH|nr:hypothetical protein EGW08_019046 [Elysia chlorotica]
MYSRSSAPNSWDQGYVERQKVFRVNDNGEGPELLIQVFLERGWVEYDEQHHGNNGWHLWWRTSRFRTSEYSGLLPWQRINHFPNCGAITRKDALCRNFRKMRIVHGPSVYSFSPQAYNLPNDYTKFVSEYAKLQSQTLQPAPLMWICKPAESSRGRGIFIFQHLSELQYDCNAVVQQYITDPLLIGGYKFDIRVYVAVQSFSPLQVYVYEEGLVRFGTEKYDLQRTDNIFAHLTNTSINKFRVNSAIILQNNIDDAQLWQKITNIIILTMLIQAPSAPMISNCFELYGFDILIDSHLRPWLLEVNLGPALSSDCQADLLAKKSMLHDLLDMVSAEPGADADCHSRSSHSPHRYPHDNLTGRTSVLSADHGDVSTESDRYKEDGASTSRETKPGLVNGYTRRLGTRHAFLLSPVLNIPQGLPNTYDLSSNNKPKRTSKLDQRGDANTGPGLLLSQRKHPGGAKNLSRRSFSIGRGSSKSVNGRTQSNVDLSSRSAGGFSNQNLRHRSNANFHPHLTYDTQTSRYTIPNNFPRTKAARYPYSQEYIDGYFHFKPSNKPPLPFKMPDKRVGGFFLVFPFSETTHGLSQTKLDTKTIIKEVQKYLRENLKTSSSSITGHEDSSSESIEQRVEAHIWAPLKC